MRQQSKREPAPYNTSLAVAFSLLAAAIYFSWISLDRLEPGRERRETLLPGLTAEPLKPPSEGLVVTSVRYQSEAQRDGVKVGDDIVRVNNLPARATKSRDYYLSRAGGDLLRLQLRHGQAFRTIVLHPGER